MKAYQALLPMLCLGLSAVAQHDSVDLHTGLREVVVTGLTGDTKLKETATPMSVISNRALRQTAATNLIDALSRQPGLSQVSTGAGISKPIIRGLGYNRVVVVNGGVRQEGQQWGDEHGIEADADNVAAVEILKGPASLMYGSDAMAGVLILRQPHPLVEGEVRANVGAEYHTNNGLKGYTVGAAGNQGGWVWNAHWASKAAHAYRNAYDGYVPGSQFAQQSTSAMIGRDGTWGHSHLTVDHFYFTPSIVEGERDSTTGQLLPSDDGVSYAHGLPYQRVSHTKAVWENDIATRQGRLRAVVGYQQNRRREYEEAPDLYGLYLRLHTVNYDVRWQSSLGAWSTAVGMGGMWQRSENLGEEFLVPDYGLFDVGAYATAQREWQRWTFSGGLRVDRRNLQAQALEEEGVLRFNDLTRHFEALTGSAGAVFHLLPQLDLRFNVARGFRSPSISELSSNGIHEGTLHYELGNANLKAEYSRQVDVGVDWSRGIVSARLSLFANHIDNFIFSHRVDTVLVPGRLTYRYDAGQARLMGMEAVVDIHPTADWHVGSSFSLVDAQLMDQPADRRYLPLTPAPRWTADAKYYLPFASDCSPFLVVELEHNFRQSHVYSADDTETPTPAYTLLNLSAGFNLMLRGQKVAEIVLVANNLTDCAYQHHLSRLKYTEVNPVTGRRGVYNMGRNVMLRVTVPLQLRRQPPTE